MVPELPADTIKPNIWSNLNLHPWVERSNDADLYLRSPIVRKARRTGKPIYWTSVREGHLSADDTQMLKDRDDSGVSQFGITIPVFGPFRRQGYVGLDLRSSKDRLNPQCLRDLQSLAQTLHLSFCGEAPAPDLPQVRLSKREHETLNLLSHGLTKSQIAQRLNVAETTVDTFVRRAYEKLGVRDRVRAVLLFLDLESRG